MSSYREAAEQALPTPGAQSVFAEVRRLLDAREAKGVATYGRTLETFNGRDAHQDGLEELLDGFLYRTQAHLERKALEAELRETRIERDTSRLQVEGLQACLREEKGWREHYRQRVTELEAKLNTAPPPAQGPRHDILEVLGPKRTARLTLKCRDCKAELNPDTAYALLCPSCHWESFKRATP